MACVGGSGARTRWRAARGEPRAFLLPCPRAARTAGHHEDARTRRVRGLVCVFVAVECAREPVFRQFSTESSWPNQGFQSASAPHGKNLETEWRDLVLMGRKFAKNSSTRLANKVRRVPTLDLAERPRRPSDSSRRRRLLVASLARKQRGRTRRERSGRTRGAIANIPT